MTPEEIRDTLPYGMWVCPTGREVMFNRRYQPIWERLVGSIDATPADPTERVRFVEQWFFYTDRTYPGRNRTSMAKCRDVLVAFIFGAPIITNKLTAPVASSPFGAIPLDTPETKPLSNP